MMSMRTRRDHLCSSSLIPTSVCRSQPYSLRSCHRTCRRRRRCCRLYHRAPHASGAVPARANSFPRATFLPRAIPLSSPRCSRAPVASFRRALAALLPLVLLTSTLTITNPPCHVALAATLDVMTPKGGCLTSRCVSYTKGRWLLPSGTASTIISANGNMNYERYKLIDSTTVILKTTATNENGCCQTCAQADKCVFFHYQPPTVAGTAGTCRLLPSLTKFTVDNTIRSVAPSYIGGSCNPLATGYEDPRLVVGGRRGGWRRHKLPIRSWIRELYMTWRDPIGRKHSVFLKARDGREQRRGERGFIQRMEMDGRSTTPPTKMGEAVQGEGSFHMVLLSAAPMGDGRDSDTYRVHVGGVASMELALHAAHPLLQTPDEAHIHFNVYIKYLNNTEAVHGVLGQTFRGEITRAKRAEEYGLLTRLLRAPIQADGETGRGFLDGDVEDYATSAIDAADCAFATAWNEAWKKVREEQEGTVVAEEEARGEVGEAQEEAWEEVRRENVANLPEESRIQGSEEYREEGDAGRRVGGNGEKRKQQQDYLTGGEMEEEGDFKDDIRKNGSGEMAADREQLVYEIFQ
ncbi:unnamed protein product [Closterium sp. Yama58-4]|nr:unnamed protein product [Closterium sp. Yama58-4]